MDGSAKMELRYSVGMRQLFGFDYRNQSRPDLYGEVCGFVKWSFRTFLASVSCLFVAVDPNFVIYFEQVKGSDGTHEMAYFDLETNSGGIFHFMVHYDSFVQIALCILAGRDTKMERCFVSTVYHKLMHAVDLSSLIRVGAQRLPITEAMG